MPEVFVFGSNEAGIHGAGSAKEALEKHGAIYGQGRGLQGNSYAIPTKDAQLRTLPLIDVMGYVNEFIAYAKKYPNTTFNVVAIGCGLAGWPARTMSKLFKEAKDLPNVNLPKEFTAWLNHHNNW